MTINKLVVGYKNADEDQIDNLADVIEALNIDPIDRLIGTPENPVPEDVDFYSLIDILKEIVDSLP